MEGELEHYSLHEHPLIYNDDQQESWQCSACGLPLLLSPSYKCNNDECNFFLHKACRQLPQESLNYVGADGFKYSLALVVKPPNDEWKCDVCRKLMCKINSITYRGSSNPSIEDQVYQYPSRRSVSDWQSFYSEMESGRRRTIHVHPLCAPFPLEIKSRHDSHKHELVAMRREAQLLCDVCGEEHKGLFFSCEEHSCNFYIYKDCAVLPRIIDNAAHHHPLAFSYSAFGAIFSGLAKAYDHCKICAKPFTCTAAYYCQQCDVIIHLNCAISLDKNSVRLETGYHGVQFPFEDGVEKSLFIHKMLNKKRIEKNEEDDTLSTEEYHEHPGLIFHDNINIDNDYKDYSSSLCNACIQPITNSPPFYSCREPGCDFLLHKHCTALPSQINPELLSFTRKSSIRYFKQKADAISSIFRCFCCMQLCNGFGYKLLDIDEDDYIVDVECASLLKAIKHQLHHAQHILVLIMDDTLPFACCSDTFNDIFAPTVYKCVSCDFKIHIRCALLPAKVNHKFDKHPLQLSKASTDYVNDSKHCFCEICEDDIDTKFWFYHCKRCDQFFHIMCIPSVGLLSKIKFGGTLVIPCHPSDHPVALTRMLNIGDQRCGECKQFIPGFKDIMVFQCSKCCYWIHYYCACRHRWDEIRKKIIFWYKEFGDQTSDWI